MENIIKLKKSYCKKRQEIEARLKEFKLIYIKGSEEELFAELCFCILTPQSRAKSCWSAISELGKSKLLTAGNTIEIAKKFKKFGVRFHNKKAKYIVDAYTFFSKRGNLSIRGTLKNSAEKDLRKFLVENINGIGYKEASHFLRNIGLGENYAILDRHILKNLKNFCTSESPSANPRILRTHVSSSQENNFLLSPVFLRETVECEELPIPKQLIHSVHEYILEDKKPLTKTRYLAIEKTMKEFAEKIGVPLSHLDLLFWSEETNEIFK